MWYRVLENCSLVYEFVKMFVTDFIILKGDVAWLCDRVPSSVILVEITACCFFVMSTYDLVVTFAD